MMLCTRCAGGVVYRWYCVHVVHVVLVYMSYYVHVVHAMLQACGTMYVHCVVGYHDMCIRCVVLCVVHVLCCVVCHV